MITQERLKNVISYDSETGVATWKVRKSNMLPGSRCGNLNNHGYYYVSVDKKRYQLHRLLWLYHYGSMPDGQIDHINGNRTDNRIVNLRVVDSRGNQQNLPAHRNGNLPGAIRSGSRYYGQIKINGFRYYLGRFDTKEQAHQAYLDKLNEHNRIAGVLR